jgi:hypothetical protein
VRKTRKTYVASDHPSTDGDPKMAFSPEAALQISGKSPTAWNALMDRDRGRATRETPNVFIASARDDFLVIGRGFLRWLGCA